LSSFRSQKITLGIFHYVGDVPCSWNEFAEVIFCEAKKGGYKIPSILTTVTSDQYPTLAVRPIYSVLCTSKIKSTFGISASNWCNALQQAISALEIR
jgi:dTDP-4-dehydrorhamnose reductase